MVQEKTGSRDNDFVCVGTYHENIIQMFLFNKRIIFVRLELN